MRRAAPVMAAASGGKQNGPGSSGDAVAEANGDSAPAFVERPELKLKAAVITALTAGK